MAPDKYLCAIVALLILFSGCAMYETETPAGTKSPAVTESSTSELTPKPLPDTPNDLTNQSVSSYVSRCERVTLWNDVLDEGVSDVEFSTLNVNVVAHNETGFTSIVYVYVWLIWDDPEPEKLGFEYTARYTVNETATTRQIVDGTRPIDKEVACE